MTPTTLPWIRADDFPRLQQIIPELQNTTFAEWQEDHEKAVAYRRPRNGSAMIPVVPSGFAEWLGKTGQTAHLELLWVYAEVVAGTPQAAVAGTSRRRLATV
jgi:hypothetical protein